jgi:hypothetical protein
VSRDEALRGQPLSTYQSTPSCYRAPIGILMGRHFRPTSVYRAHTSDVDAALEDLRAELKVERIVVRAVFRRVCAALNCFAERSGKGTQPPIDPFQDPAICEAIATCFVAQEQLAHDRIDADSFYRADFQRTLTRVRRRKRRRSAGLTKPAL